MLRQLLPVVSTALPQVRYLATTVPVAKNKVNRVYYSPMQSIQCVRNTAVAHYDETFEVTANLGIDPKKTNQIVRGILMLPHGNGKRPRIAVFADGQYAEEAKEAGADLIGLDDLINDVKQGKINFDVAITVPRYVPKLAPVARILGPKKLMPSTRNGTVTSEVGKAIRDVMRGKVEIKPDKQACVHLGIGKMSFKDEQLLDNLKEFVIQLSSIKPPAVKHFVQSICVCSTQSPSFFIDPKFFTPGRSFFNEEFADSSLVIPEKVVKPSTRKRHAAKESKESKEVKSE